MAGGEGKGHGCGPRGVARGVSRHSPPPDSRTRDALHKTTSHCDESSGCGTTEAVPALPASEGGPENAPEGAAGSNCGRGRDAAGVLAQLEESSPCPLGSRAGVDEYGRGFSWRP